MDVQFFFKYSACIVRMGKHQAPTALVCRGLIVYCCRRLFFRVVPVFAVPTVFAVTFKGYIVLTFGTKITGNRTQCEGKFSLKADNFRVRSDIIDLFHCLMV